ncbi:MAG: arsenate reductase ArsC [Acidimicrobiales bacterium]
MRPTNTLHSIAEKLAGELEGTFALETVERFVKESYDHLAATAQVTPFLPVLTEHFARDRLRAYAKAEGAFVSHVPDVLVVCTHNAGRSVAARVLIDHYARGRIDVRSAGSAPGDTINPAVAEVLAERGLDASKEFPKPLTDEIARAADVIITMGCGDACPVFPGKRCLDWELTDPAGKSIDEVRPIIDDIDRRVQALVAELVHAPA